MVDPLRRAIEENRRSQDRLERAKYEVSDRLWDTDEAISNRIRFFAVGVLVVSWGLLIQEAGIDTQSVFDMRLILSAAVLSVVSLVLDFLYLTFRRSALIHAIKTGSSSLEGSGPQVQLAGLMSWLRVVVFCVSAGTLLYAVITGLLPIAFAPRP